MFSTSIFTIFVLIISVYHTTFADILTSLLPNTHICGLQSTNDSGTEDIAGLGEFPWSALIGYMADDKFQFSCEGTLINNQFVITSAYCVKNHNDFDLIVRLGQHTINKGSNCTSEDSTKCHKEPLNINISQVIVHDDYTGNNSMLNDIALIELNGVVTFSDYISPICVPTSSKLLSNKYEGSVMTLAGWGSFDNDLATTVKRKMKATVKPTEECNSKFSSSLHEVTINENQLCASSTNYFCKGNPGSALAIQDGGNWYLTGIVSFGVTTCPSDFPTVYTRASSFAQWIVETLEDEVYYDEPEEEEYDDDDEDDDDE